MVTFEQTVKGIAAFIEAEIISMLPGWKKWAAGGLVAMALDRSASIFKTAKDHPVIKSMGIIREDGMIDVESLYKYFRAAADKTGPITIEVPLAGALKVSAQDLDNLYNKIIGG